MNVNVYSPINQLGYGIHGLNMIKSMMDKNVNVNLTPIGQIQNDPYFEFYWQKANNSRPTEFNIDNPSLFIFHDEYSNNCCGKRTLVYSIFETTQPKKESIYMLNNGAATDVLVTTEQHKEILQHNGITKPIHVIHEGIDSSIFNNIPVDKHIVTNKFTFITVGKKELRKNSDLTLLSFINGFKNRKAALISHTFNPFVHKNQQVHPFKNLECWTNVNLLDQGFRYVESNNKYHKWTHNDCDIYFTMPTIQTAEMSCLYHSADAGITISRGEAWGLPTQEMLACGLPVIYNTCMGFNEYIDIPENNSNIIITNDMELATDNLWFNGNVGEWTKPPSEEEIINKMFQLYDSIEVGTKNDKIANFMENNYSWSLAVDKLLTII